MAVTVWKEVSGDDGSLTNEWVREYTRRFLAGTDTWRDSAVAILIDRRCPKPWTQHPHDPLAFVTSVIPTRRSDTSLWWDVAVDYSSEIDQQDQKEENPLARKPIIAWKSAHRSEIQTHDVDDEPIVNKANDPYVPAIEDEVTDWVISVQRNIARVPAWLLDYGDAPVNDDAVRIQGITFPRFSLRLFDIAISDLQHENRVPFYTVSWELRHRKRGWHHLVPNRGFQELYDSNGDGELDNKRKILIDGEPPSTAQWLDAQGKWLKKPERTELIFTEHHTAPRRPFRRLLG